MKKTILFFLLLSALTIQAQIEITCQQAREYALKVSANNELYNGGETYVVQGYVTNVATAWNSTYHNVTFWMADTEDGGKVIEAYRCVAETQADAPNVGSLVRVTGQLTKYGSTPEFAQGCTCQILTNTEAPVNLGPKTIAEFLELKNTKDTCILTGVATNISTTAYGYGNFYIQDNTASVYVYNLANFAGFDIEEGDTVTVAGVYHVFGSTPEVTGVRFISRVHPTPVVPVVEVSLLRVCAQNLQNYYYNYDLSTRPKYYDAEGFRVKTLKIVNAMLSIDADIYAFCEVEAKPIVLQQLADSMNAHAGVTGRYAAVNDGIDYTWYDGISDNQIKSGFIYRTDKVATVGSNTGAVGGNGYYAHTMRIQAFKQLPNDEKFIISMNHFKAKDSSSDQGESIRQGNANNLVNALSNLYLDPDILILGDLNCEVEEAPIQTIIDAGFEEQLLKYNSKAWSHCWGNGELIDHVLANPSMAEQIEKAYVKHICASACNNAVSDAESWSDHDPYVVELMLGKSSNPTALENIPTASNAQKILRNGQIIIIRSGVEYTVTGQRVY